MELHNLLTYLQAQPPEILWLLLLLLSFGGVLGMLRFFGEAGLYVYIVLATAAANIQVLKPVDFAFFAEPIPLGTVLFATTYLCTDILGEYFGKDAAKRGVFIGFAGFFLWTLLMFITIGFQPLANETAHQTGVFNGHDAIANVFTPMPVFFIAGMAAYLVSQLHDVYCFQWLKKRMDGRHLWLRNNLSTALSALIDNTVFSLLAWVVLADEPIPLKTVILTYILGTWGLRIGVAVLDTPVLYAAKKCLSTQTSTPS